MKLKEYKEGEPFYILSINGGGIRGMFPASILARLEEDLHSRGQCKDLKDLFHLIVGTSTGSILAAGIACGIGAGEMNGLYKNCGDSIFQKNPWYQNGLGQFASLTSKIPKIGGCIKTLCRSRQPQYHKKKLEKKLREILGTKRLSEVSVPLMIPTTTVDNPCGVAVFKSIYSKEFLRDGEIMVTDAILSSCAAPFYFQPHRFSVRNRSYCQSDGGLWANDPIMCGITEALGSRFNVRLEDIRVLSLQNGAEIPSDIGQGDDNWRWDIAKFAELVFYLQSHTAQNQADLLLKTKNPDAPKAILKIDVEKKGNKSWKLDDCSCIEELDRHAQEIYDNKAPEIRRFLGFED